MRTLDSNHEPQAQLRLGAFNASAWSTNFLLSGILEGEIRARNLNAP
jgi:hypothetical protein